MRGVMSCLPSSWNTNKRKIIEANKSSRRVKRAHNSVQTVSHIETVRQAVKQALDQLDDAGDMPPVAVPVELDPLLESIPFVRLLSSISAPPPSGDVALVTRKYEEQFMRECRTNKERKCVMGPQCECMVLDQTQPFVGVQFVLPTTLNAPAVDLRDGMCLLCLRKTTQILFYQTIERGHTVNALIQKHGNVCDEPGEYHHNAMLICPPHGPVHCMPLPMVAHQRSNYEVVKKQGVFWVVQKNVGYEDFT
jgi:hypothetical protein